MESFVYTEHWLNEWEFVVRLYSERIAFLCTFPFIRFRVGLIPRRVVVSAIEERKTRVRSEQSELDQDDTSTPFFRSKQSRVPLFIRIVDVFSNPSSALLCVYYRQ